MWTHVAGVVSMALLPQPKGVASPQNPSDYQVLIGEGLVGSAFVIRYREQLWGVVSIHQFEGKTPSRLEQLEGEPGEIHLRPEGALRQHDVQIVPLRDQKAGVPFLAYDSDIHLARAEALTILGPAGETVPATLNASAEYRCSEGPRELTASAARPFVAGGGSGAPIIQESTGRVVGVLLQADDAEKARQVAFETLCLPIVQQTRAEGVPADAASPDFHAVAGRWTLDYDYARELWKQEQGEAYDANEWAKIVGDPEATAADEVRLDEKAVAFFKAGHENIRYPVLGWRAENGVVWVSARHFLGGEMKWGFVATGSRLKILHSNGTWWFLQAFRRATLIPSAHPAESGRKSGRVLVAGVVVTFLAAGLILLVALIIKRHASGRRRP